jgi:hypothetical protein
MNWEFIIFVREFPYINIGQFINSLSNKEHLTCFHFLAIMETDGFTNLETDKFCLFTKQNRWRVFNPTSLGELLDHQTFL